MDAADVVVVGAGISGASFAAEAARAGRRVLVLEAERAPGGALATARHPSGFWIELGAHTLYSSYVETIRAIEAAGLLGELQRRAKPVLRFLEGDRVLPGRNLGALLRRLDLVELLGSLPRWIGARPEGRTVREHYGRLVGRGNYDRVLSPILSAVPSQRADDLPADLLFKRRRARREDLPRSFTLKGGLRRLPEALLARPGIEVRAGARAAAVEDGAGGGFTVLLADGAAIAARAVALAVHPSAAAACLRAARPALAARVAEIAEARVTSLGVVLPAARARPDPATFLIPLEDAFLSVVTRDVVPDPERRGFTFHFRPGTDAAGRRARAAAVLGVPAAELEPLAERQHVLPSPRRGHAQRVAAIDRELAGGRLALTGNWLEGLSIEDCVRRSAAEWARIAAL